MHSLNSQQVDKSEIKYISNKILSETYLNEAQITTETRIV